MEINNYKNAVFLFKLDNFEVKEQESITKICSLINILENVYQYCLIFKVFFPTIFFNFHLQSKGYHKN